MASSAGHILSVTLQFNCARNAATDGVHKYMLANKHNGERISLSSFILYVVIVLMLDLERKYFYVE